MRLKSIRLNEVTELEPLVIRQIDEIEDGLQVLQNQLGVGESGRPDIIAVDADGGLVLIELKAGIASVDALLQALRYRDWLTDNKTLLARVYPQVRPDRPVRLFVGAPDFDDEIHRLARYLSIEVTFVSLVAVKNLDNGEIGLVIETEEVERAAEPEIMLYSVQDILDYLEEPVAKASLRKVLEDLRILGSEMRPYRAGKYRWLEFMHDGEPIAYIGTLKKGFKSQHFDAAIDDWPKPLVVESYEHWCKVSKPHIESLVRTLASRA
jgi:predicted RecB family endonuclease